MLLITYIFPLLVTSSLNLCAASDKYTKPLTSPKETLDHYSSYALEQQRLAYQNYICKTLAITNSTPKPLTLTFRIKFRACCPAHEQMCRFTVVQRLEADKEQHVLIPAVWETVDISDETAEPSHVIAAGMSVLTPWTHHGTYRNIDVLGSSGELRLTNSSAGEVLFLKAERLIRQAPEHSH